MKLILGRAGSGKTSRILELINERVSQHLAGNIYIVPEQYSHDAERELAESCPPEGPLYAEVLSFTRLSARISAEIGGLADRMIDKGGKTLAMSRALYTASPMLNVYSLGKNKSDFLGSLIETYEELRSYCISPGDLARVSPEAEGELKEKLFELSIIFENYESIKEQSGLDSGDRLQRLAEGIAESSLGQGYACFLDGFTDFTAQELEIIDELMHCGCQVTVSLSADDMLEPSMALSLGVSTARRLMTMASARGQKCEIEFLEPREKDRDPALRYMEQVLLDRTNSPYEGPNAPISVVAAANAYEECCAAAGRVLELVQKGARFRDIAVVSSQWEEYAALAAGAFEKFGIPVNTTEKEGILTKPVLCYLTSALEIITEGWSYDSVMRFLKTGLTGVSDDDRDIFENYILKWNIRGIGAYTGENWKMPPGGFSEHVSQEDICALERINKVRVSFSEPLAAFDRAFKEANTAFLRICSIYDFMESTDLYNLLRRKVEELETQGLLRQADEYSQLWDILLGALEESAAILGDAELEPEELVRLISLVLEQFDVATIPSSQDAVGCGDMSRMRGRGIRHLIVLGATDTALPKNTERHDLIGEEDRRTLKGLGLELPDRRDDSLARELGLVYSSLTMPKDSLMLTYPVQSRRSYVVTRLMSVFSLDEKPLDRTAFISAREPALELAASGGNERWALAARRYFEESPEGKASLAKLENAAKMPRGRLTRMTAERLYGREINISASRLDKFYSCRYSYFLKYGLKLNRRDKAGLDAPETGTFIHYVLEKTAGQVHDLGGFKEVGDSELLELSRKYCREYADIKLGGLEGKTGRFKYLFRRLSEDAGKIVLTLAEEMRRSSFEPLAFELSFAKNGDLPPVELAGEEGSVRINGIADRVDGWVHRGKLYLRVVDYKTGKKSFKLSDVSCGMGLQMLIYLFALQKEGGEKYGMDIVPAGVIYAPARDEVIAADHRLTDEELSAERRKTQRRSGLLLDEPEVLEAMEQGEKFEFLPVKLTKDKLPSGDSLASAEQLGALSRHVDMVIKRMGDELLRGSVTADPYYRGQRDMACTFCDYFGACHFRSSGEDKPRFLSHIKTAEAWKKIEEGA